MTVDPRRLAPVEQRALVRGTLYRILGTPVVAVFGLVNTAIIVRNTGEEVFGLVSLVATTTLLFPFADLGIGATVLSAAAALNVPQRDPDPVDVIRRAYRTVSAVAGGVIVGALVVMAIDGWGPLVGMSTGPADRWAITVAVVLFALTIPAGLGVRILIGIDRNHIATLVLMSAAAFSLLLTLALTALDVAGIWYALSALGGVLAGHIVGTVVALRLSGLGRSIFEPVSAASARIRLLKGSLWMFVAGVGLPVGLQSGRLLLAHLSTPAELSAYALMAQMYGVGWSVLSTAGMAYWPVFVKRRGAIEATVRMWWSVTAIFTAAAALGAGVLTTLGPWVASVLSDGRVDVAVALACSFGVLFVAQGCHLPSGVLLTRPTEARWQAWCIVAMAVIGLGLGLVLARPYGAVGVVTAGAVGVFVGQVVPDLLRVPTLVRRRPPVEEPGCQRPS
ncbi:lipopolysaccharide biosynthesis protein [Rhodococcus aetherivorans]|uniref:lipopolysaccharide biosynthesis protein n=1 Tax=Rhodococcus aetherivorans TaxID=191292 RepID=UPI00294A80B3|nr:oligosaccharide flippase family protein [Rhodococcus aetherivorans]MDV6295450.1 oligosaccharide flippase family protein [Rhodococcus aetherivorans]